MLLAIDQALAEQSSAIENGLPVSNPTQLSILRLQTLDKLEQSQLSLRTLRASLSQLIPSEVACSYHPCLENEDWQPSDLCDEIQDGLRRRCDLQAIELLIMHGTLEHLELSRGLLGSLVGLPQIGSALAKKSWKSLLGLDHREKEEELCRIKGLLRDAKRFLEMQISSEIETLGTSGNRMNSVPFWPRKSVHSENFVLSKWRPWASLDDHYPPSFTPRNWNGLLLASMPFSDRRNSRSQEFAWSRRLGNCPAANLARFANPAAFNPRLILPHSSPLVPSSGFRA